LSDIVIHPSDLLAIYTGNTVDPGQRISGQGSNGHRGASRSPWGKYVAKNFVPAVPTLDLYQRYVSLKNAVH